MNFELLCHCSVPIVVVNVKCFLSCRIRPSGPYWFDARSGPRGSARRLRDPGHRHGPGQPPWHQFWHPRTHATFPTRSPPGSQWPSVPNGSLVRHWPINTALLPFFLYLDADSLYIYFTGEELCFHHFLLLAIHIWLFFFCVSQWMIVFSFDFI